MQPWEHMMVHGKNNPKENGLYTFSPAGLPELVNTMQGTPANALITINQLGAEGWQLVSVDHEGLADSENWTYWLKRPLQGD